MIGGDDVFWVLGVVVGEEDFDDCVWIGGCVGGVDVGIVGGL